MSDELAEAARLAGQRLLAWEEDREWLTDHEVALYREAIANHYLSTLTAPTPVDWQPIETAPKDGSPILAIGNCYGRPDEGVHYAIARWESEWVEGEDDEEQTVLKYLTHWKPLDTPPTLSRPKPQ